MLDPGSGAGYALAPCLVPLTDRLAGQALIRVEKIVEPPIEIAGDSPEM